MAADPRDYAEQVCPLCKGTRQAMAVDIEKAGNWVSALVPSGEAYPIPRPLPTKLVTCPLCGGRGHIHTVETDEQQSPL